MPSAPPSMVDAFRTTLELFETGLEVMRQNLRRSRPEAGDGEIERLLHVWLLDRPRSGSWRLCRPTRRREYQTGVTSLEAALRQIQPTSLKPTSPSH